MSILPQSTSIYALIDPRDGCIRYVGKANNPDVRLRNHVKEARKGGADYKCRWVMSVLDAGGYPLLQILEECAYAEWKEREIYWIARLRAIGCRLANCKDGGDGIDPDDTTRAKMSAAKKGKPARNKGAKTPDEVKAKQSAAAKRRWARMTDGERQAYVIKLADHERKPVSEETREKFREIGRNRTYTPEQNVHNSARQLIFNSEQVVQIRQMIADGILVKHIARQLGCSTATISNIKMGKSYR